MFRVVNRGTEVDLAINRLARLAISHGTTPHQMTRETRNTLAGWRGLPKERRHVARLRVMLVTGLASAVERMDTAGPLEQRRAQTLVDVLRAGGAAVDEWLKGGPG